ncbi:hypothetical protein GCK72_009531 [Caenorhabditis remanei]|uniref:GYF domain-containing protein n=1 Tax=Caenorhabditis remanei TaxID=31234 RepID=A0A6A5H362_CAERE|nr:hypothetical protein GCK72_009531 [Caenorhabditis remanei]KAF1761276.1 hypothetical protein GCK72_009531 [Caenorhabditis remanei]
MEEIDDDELTIYYIDDAGKNQGPFAATVVLGWVQKGHFSDKHCFRITDNGQRIGKLITIDTTVGELKATFGEEAPIPVKIQTVLDTRSENSPVYSFGRTVLSSRAKSPVRFQPFHVKSSSNLKELDKVESQAGTGKISQHQTEKLIKREDSEEYSWVPNENEKRLSISNHDLKSDLEPPPNFTRKEGRSDNNSESKKENFAKQEKNISFRNKNIPFYHKDKNNVVIIELTKLIQLDYNNLSKKERDRLHSNIKEWDLPERCKVCDCELKMSANFLSHVLSTAHIKKSCSKNAFRFTFEGDYMTVKNEIEQAKKEEKEADIRERFNKHYPRKQSGPKHTNPESFQSADPDIPFHARQKCAQSRYSFYQDCLNIQFQSIVYKFELFSVQNDQLGEYVSVFLTHEENFVWTIQIKKRT